MGAERKPWFGSKAQGPPHPLRGCGGLAVLGPALVAEAMGCCGLRVISLLQAPTLGASQGPQSGGGAAEGAPASLIRGPYPGGGMRLLLLFCWAMLGELMGTSSGAGGTAARALGKQAEGAGMPVSTGEGPGGTDTSRSTRTESERCGLESQTSPLLHNVAQ